MAKSMTNTSFPSSRKPARGNNRNNTARRSQDAPAVEYRTKRSNAPSSRAPEVTVRGRSHSYWMFGWHSVLAALANPERQCKRLWVTENAQVRLMGDPATAALAAKATVEKVTQELFARVLPPDTLHQGIALEVTPLPALGMEALVDSTRKGPILLLDQVTDPHNLGAILRSAAAFDSRGVLITERHGAHESGVVARAAAGALEAVPLVRVGNLVQAMLALKSAGYWCVGLDASGEKNLRGLDMGPKVALLLGAEGKGLRRLTLEHCDILARLPIHPRMESLNVSNAAAIALYELYSV
jgi:23S rRNA (guanosine2251-2'-O)-methyltransferase